MDSKHIGQCKYCDQFYCQECTDALSWALFCSTECEDQHKEENKVESMDDSDEDEGWL